uniref:Uncharacterized protein n=1 Tax=Anguilla anguilla TaxID=7936 RepID=A0A0E9RUB7_ANGAN
MQVLGLLHCACSLTFNNENREQARFGITSSSYRALTLGYKTLEKYSPEPYSCSIPDPHL